jgi:hypothetical protein
MDGEGHMKGRPRQLAQKLKDAVSQRFGPDILVLRPRFAWAFG